MNYPSVDERVVDAINDSGEINYSVEGVVQDVFSFEPGEKMTKN